MYPSKALYSTVRRVLTGSHLEARGSCAPHVGNVFLLLERDGALDGGVGATASVSFLFLNGLLL
jgi:hypothetical protein